MQHYGAPTRLLDWTYSFFVAAYFALNRLGGTSKAIIVLDAKSALSRAAGHLYSLRHRFAEHVRSLLEEQKDDPFKQLNSVQDQLLFAELAMNNISTFAYPVTPFQLNDRIAAQQGTFLCAGNIANTFQSNLDAVASEDTSGRIITLAFGVGERSAALHELRRMNITQATLFPGLQGYAEAQLNHWSLLEPRYELDKIPLVTDE